VLYEALVGKVQVRHTQTSQAYKDDKQYEIMQGTTQAI